MKRGIQINISGKNLLVFTIGVFTGIYTHKKIMKMAGDNYERY